MPKGGFTKNNKSHENYLFKSKWNLGKTTVIRIPEILKDEFLHLAKYLDNKEKEKIQKINLVEELKGNITLDKSNRYQIAVECFEEFIESQKLDLSELSKAKKGTKKRQLSDIHQWLTEQFSYVR